MQKEIKKEIINDIVNFLNQLKDDNDIIHIDNLKEEIEDNPELFSYSLKQFNLVIKKIFN